MNRAHVIDSRILDDQLCKSDRIFNTTYNGDKDIPPFVGIMFEISSFTDVEVISFEVDIRWDMKPSDLSIQVYTIEGRFSDFFNNSSAWELIASTDIVPAPEGNSGVIPASDFTSVNIKALEVRSFYITMNGPYIDHTVYGLQKTGDIHIKADDIQLYVGSGFTSNNFTGEIDKVLDPQFAGVVYYTKSYQCDDNQARSTSIIFQFLLESDGVDDSFVLSYNAAIDTAIDSIIKTNLSLKSFVNDFGLQKSSGAVTTKKSFTGECPIDWIDCAPILLSTTIRFTHMNALETSRIQFDMYSLETSMNVISTIKESVASGERNIVNLGIESASAQVQVVINGVPVEKLVDDIQIRYFEDTTQLFLDKFLGDMAVFSVVASIDNNNNKLRHLAGKGSNGTLSVSLFVDGAHPVGTSIDEYVDAIDNACKWQEDVYISLLKQNGVRPGEINEGERLEYFRSISSISCKVNKIVHEKTQKSSADRTLIRNVIIGVVINICIIIATFCWIRHLQQKRRKCEEDAKYREERKKERRLRRLERSSQELSARSVDLLNHSDEIGKEKVVDRSGSRNVTKQEKKKSDSPSSSSIPLEQKKLRISDSTDPVALTKDKSSKQKLTGNGPRAISRPKSLSPTSGIRRAVDPSNFHRSLDLSTTASNLTDFDDGHRRSNKCKFNGKQTPSQVLHSSVCVSSKEPATDTLSKAAAKKLIQKKNAKQSSDTRARQAPPNQQLITDTSEKSRVHPPIPHHVALPHNMKE